MNGNLRLKETIEEMIGGNWRYTSRRVSCKRRRIAYKLPNLLRPRRKWRDD
jgi:hypothetical protein